MGSEIFIGIKVVSDEKGEEEKLRRVVSNVSVHQNHPEVADTPSQNI